MTADPRLDYADLRDLCESYARAAGSLAKAGRIAARAGAALAELTKSSPTDLVTEFDRAAEQLIVEAIRRDRPDDAIIGEEGAEHAGSSGFAWHVDPIDGTTNFVYDLPTWACSIGVTHDGVGVAGAVFAPMVDELYAAAAGHGATLNSVPIRASALTDPALALIATGFAYQPDTRVAQARQVLGLAGHVRDFRRFGAASYDLCMVACGRVDAYYEQGLNSWDIAAGELICREAGAVTSDWSSGPVRPAEVLAAAPGIHAEFLTLLRRAAVGTV
jgi:myo-inositol-1(or 4)-monophosphatase